MRVVTLTPRWVDGIDQPLLVSAELWGAVREVVRLKNGPVLDLFNVRQAQTFLGALRAGLSEREAPATFARGPRTVENPFHKPWKSRHRPENQAALRAVIGLFESGRGVVVGWREKSDRNSPVGP